MGSSSGDGDGQIKTTQILNDSQAFHSPDHSALSTLLFEDTVRVEECGLDTQALNFDEETQVLEDPDFLEHVPTGGGFGTQVVDFGGDTQVLDDDLGSLEDMCTQLIDEVVLDSDTDGLEMTTQVLSEIDDLIDEELGRGDERRSSEVKMSNCVSSCEATDKRFTEHIKTLTDGRECSRSVPRFVSIRVDSMRASALSARSPVSKRTSNKLYSVQTSNKSLEQETVKNSELKMKAHEEADIVYGTQTMDYRMQELGHRKKSNLGCSVARELFHEGSFVENEGLSWTSDNMVKGKAEIQVPSIGDGLSELSYINSQEPGELSQANALACVQKLIEESKESLETDNNLGRINQGRSNCITSAKGHQNLAKKANQRGRKSVSGIFDWDDNLEDEGGGEIFQRRKKDFLGSGNLVQKSFTETKNPNRRLFDGCMDNTEKLNLKNKLTKSSDSKFHGNTTKQTDVTVRKNLVNEFNKDAAPNKMEATLTKNIPERHNVSLYAETDAKGMESFACGVGTSGQDAVDDPMIHSVTSEDSPRRSTRTKNNISSKECSPKNISGVGVTAIRSKRGKRIQVQSGRRSSPLSLKYPEISQKECHTNSVMKRKRARSASDTHNHSIACGSKTGQNMGPGHIKQGNAEDTYDNLVRCLGDALTGDSEVKMQESMQEVAPIVPIARRTRQSMLIEKLENAKKVPISLEEKANCHTLKRSKAGGMGAKSSNILNGKRQREEHCASPCRKHEKLNSEKTIVTDTVTCAIRRSSRIQLNKSDDTDAQSNSSPRSGCKEKSFNLHKRSLENAQVNASEGMKRRTRSSMSICLGVSSMKRNSEEQLPQNENKQGSGDTALSCKSSGVPGEMKAGSSTGVVAVELSNGKSHADCSAFPQNKLSPSSEKLISKPTGSECRSPNNCITHVNAVSPVCMGDGYFTLSCKKNLSGPSLTKEISSLCATRPKAVHTPKDLRKKRDLAAVRVLFSNHLEKDVIKQQQKIMDRLKISVASSITDATHFIADKFVRTRNMLEAIASGKPVVTPLWLQNVGQAKCYIDEEKYVLRDVKKEKEIGFNLQASIALARHHPLLQGQKVLITSGAKPTKEIVLSLVQKVHGQPIERVGRSTMKDGMSQENILILTCEDDYEACVPFLEKGIAVYSSELLLNGIVTQKLEYERYQLFQDKVKRTRSTIWMKKDGRNYVPVQKR